ncbi:hypothetical protein BTA51_23215 [Hahella sp. CCB-MM4]|uniref:sensor histidine kinase n=1 Tax=Hahella sp. (strain CCB-MM4) TaxID=1926491 RepID=UPI000B9BB8FC|nr:HAMP domain-containing sensor histidine kinase [Hahella sp. CCB-MM4]OZG71018.1 hypothetical protein BTA51_23215 [Hahella sp. CCB-MM4]
MIQRFLKLQATFIDKLTPVETLDTEERARARVVVGIILYGAVSALIMGIVRISSLGLVASTVLTFSLVPILLGFLFILWTYRNLALTSDLLVGLLALILLCIAITDGGVSSRVLVWMPAVPLLASFVGSKLKALRSTLILASGLFALVALHYREVLEYRWDDGAVVGRVMATVFSMLFVSAICHQYENARRRAVSEYNAMEIERRNWTSMVAHELRTPLTALFGALSLLQKQIEQIAEGEVQGRSGVEATRELILMGKRNSERLIRLVNDILDLERLQSGNMPLHKSCFPLNTLLSETSAFCMKMAEEKGLRIRTDMETDLKVTADEDRIFQVVLNLVSNAIKFGVDGEVIEISLKQHGEFARIAVRDFGPGVPQDFHKDIFRPFAQAAKGETRLSGGSGLGLFISRRIIEAHGGSLNYQNEPVGCSFYFDLPIC